MKIYFYLGMGIIITLIVGLLGYGVYQQQHSQGEGNKLTVLGKKQKN